jgi:methyltransferase (TIGR00027 family)
MANKAARTDGRVWPEAGKGVMPIAVVAIEQSFPKEDRVVDDPLTLRMLPSGVRLMVCLMRIGWLRDWVIGISEKTEPGIWGDFLVRKRYIDDRLRAAGDRIEAVVNLGAGFDTRAYRLPAISHLPVWEVDQLQNIVAKEKRLNELFGEVPSRIRLVAIDFDTEDLAVTLKSNAYLSARRTFFVWEAVSQYLTEQGVRKTFDFLAQAPTGSCLAMSYVRKDFLDGRNLYGWEAGYKRFVAGKMWHFGMEPEVVPGFLREYGWELIEDVGYDQLARQSPALSQRGLAATPVERMVYAEKLKR